MSTLSFDTKLSQNTVEFLLTAGAAFFAVRLYNASPVIITGITLCAAFFVPLLVKKPEYAILCIIPILPFREVHIVSIIYLRSVLIWPLLAYTLWRYAINTHKTSSRNLRVFNKVLGVFFLALAISLLKMVFELDSTTLITYGLIKAMLFYYAPLIIEGFLLLYIVYYSMYTIEHIQRLIDVSFMTSIIITILGIIQYFYQGIPPFVGGLFDQGLRFYGRATSVFSNPNDLGGFTAFMFTIALVSFIWGRHRKTKRILFIFPVLLLNLVALILSFSRGSVLQVFLTMFIIGYVYYTKMCRAKLSWKIILFIIIIGIGLGFAVNYYDLYMRARIVSRNETDYQRALFYTRTRNDYLRKYAASQALQSAVRHPFLGIGANMFSGKGVAGVRNFGLASHNQFLKILVEMGLLGLIPFVTLFVIVMKKGMRLWDKSGERQVEQNVQSMMLLLVSGVSVIIFGFLFTDSLTSISVNGALWAFSGAIFVLDRQYNTM